LHPEPKVDPCQLGDRHHSGTVIGSKRFQNEDAEQLVDTRSGGQDKVQTYCDILKLNH
jgi:hypothetical protein